MKYTKYYITSTNFTENYAGFSGGAIYADGIDKKFLSQTDEIINCHFHHNFINNTLSNTSCGGAVFSSMKNI